MQMVAWHAALLSVFAFSTAALDLHQWYPDDGSWRCASRIGCAEVTHEQAAQVKLQESGGIPDITPSSSSSNGTVFSDAMRASKQARAASTAASRATADVVSQECTDAHGLSDCRRIAKGKLITHFPKNWVTLISRKCRSRKKPTLDRLNRALYIRNRALYISRRKGKPKKSKANSKKEECTPGQLYNLTNYAKFHKFTPAELRKAPVCCSRHCTTFMNLKPVSGEPRRPAFLRGLSAFCGANPTFCDVGMSAFLCRVREIEAKSRGTCGIALRTTTTNFLGKDVISAGMNDDRAFRAMYFKNFSNYGGCNAMPAFAVSARLNMSQTTNADDDARKQCTFYFFSLSSMLEAVGTKITGLLRRGWYLKNPNCTRYSPTPSKGGNNSSADPLLTMHDLMA